MDNQPSGKNKNKLSNKRISIRKHLPLAVRVHYDAVRNWSPVKLAGLGAMAMIAGFGVLLAAQIVSPQSSANAVSCANGTDSGGVTTPCTPTSLTLEQSGNVANVTLVNTGHSPAVISYVVSNDSKCDSSTGDVITRIYNGIRVEGYKGGVEFSGGDGGYPYYQDDGADSWLAAWRADNNKEFEFEYPIISWGDSDADYSMAPHGKYLCMSISYWDNNANFKTYKGFDLMYVEMTSKTRTDAGTTYQFASNRNAHWAYGSASGLDCDLEVNTDDSASNSFTLEANGKDHRFRRCVKARDADGIEASVVFFVSETDADPTKRESTDDEDDDDDDQSQTDNQQDDSNNDDGQNGGDNGNGGQGTQQNDDNNGDDGQNDGNTGNNGQNNGNTGNERNSDGTTVNLVNTQNSGGGNGGQGNTGGQNNNPGGNQNETTSNQAGTNTQRESLVVANGGSGGTGDDGAEAIPDTGLLDDEQSWFQLAGYILIGAAILGAVRVMLVKKYKRVRQ